MPIANHPHYTTMIGFASKEPSGVAKEFQSLLSEAKKVSPV